MTVPSSSSFGRRLMQTNSIELLLYVSVGTVGLVLFYRAMFGSGFDAVPLGSWMEFHAGGNGESFTGRGWSNPEGWGSGQMGQRQ